MSKKTSKTLKLLFLLLTFTILVSCASAETKIFNAALELQKNGKYEDAIGMYNKVINQYPQSQFVANSSVKLIQCIDSIIKEGDDMVLKKDYFKAVSYYESALKFRENDLDLQNKRNKTKNLITGGNQNTESITPATNNVASTDEYKTAIDALNRYKGKKIQDFQSVSKILSMLMDWENAWESRNINLYSSYYDTSFIGVSSEKTMNYNQWISYKNNLFNRYTSINVETKLNNALVDGNRLKVYFEQWFNGEGPTPYSDYGFKELIFEYKQSGGWVIVSEKPY